MSPRVSEAQDASVSQPGSSADACLVFESLEAARCCRSWVLSLPRLLSSGSHPGRLDCFLAIRGSLSIDDF